MSSVAGNWQETSASTTFTEVTRTHSLVHKFCPLWHWEQITKALVQCCVVPSPEVSSDTSLHSKVATDHKDNCQKSLTPLYPTAQANRIFPNQTWDGASELHRSSSSKATWPKIQRTDEPSTSTVSQQHSAHVRPVLLQLHSWQVWRQTE